MRRPFNNEISDAAARLGMSEAELCARLAKKLGVSKKIIVRKADGSRRVVTAGQRLVLAEGEFIANMPIAMRRRAERAIKANGVSRNDLD